MYNHYVLIDTERLRFLKATKTLEQAQYWAEILIPASDFLITGWEKKCYSCFTEYELKVLYSNTLGQDYTGLEATNYNKVLTAVIDMARELKVDTTSLGDLKAKLGRDLLPPKPPAPTEASRGPKPVGEVKRPKQGSTTAKVWDIADEMMKSNQGLGITSKEFRTWVIEACVKEGINPSTAATQFAKWKGSK